MRTTPEFRLIFLLPDQLAFAVPAGRHQPCLHGCVLAIDRLGRVTISGPSRERVFDQASRFLRIHSKGKVPMSIAAQLVTPTGAFGGPATDKWSIAVNAEVAFTPSAMDPMMFGAEPELVP